MAQFSNGVCWLQIVETPDKHISGQFESLILNEDGKIEATDLPVVGAADDKDVTLSLGETTLFTRAISASGTLSWGELKITGPFSGNQPFTATFRRSSTEEFES
jgi:hypothetical protein